MEKIKGYKAEYWEGKTNKFARYWVYLDNGFNLINKARYFGLALIAIAGAIVSGSYFGWGWTVVIMSFIVVILLPLIALLGRWHLYHVAKNQEYIMRVKSSVLGYNDFNIQVDILNELKKLNENFIHRTRKS